ncbi:MAG TPA: flagellar filament capping protein FliD [Tepidisphaeraceae bacterium]|jgi:flagellar hook-associated protein 2|nr:flagellar filament capping protein FliD [Tepidisphaeraceae bacterium]
MAGITSGVGLASGFPTKDIIDQLMSLEARPKVLLKNRMDLANAQRLAYTDLAARLTSIRLSATAFKKTATFQQATASSSDENVLTANAAAGASKGTFQFQVARLVSAQQAVSAGFTDTESQKVGAGTITIEMGGGEISSQTVLSKLNGGEGVSRGAFRITDRSGKTGVIDISSAYSLDDVVRKINTSLDISVKAAVDGDQLVITDLTGQSASNLIVTDLGGGTAAADLGIASSVNGPTLTGNDINYVGRLSATADLNDGRGIRNANGAADFRITDANGGTYDVTVKGLTTVGAVIDAINTATAGTVVASVVTGENGIRLTDTTGGVGTVAVSALNSSLAAHDLGIDEAAVGTVISGRDVMASINSVLLSSLRGGNGLSLGTVDFTHRSGGLPVTLDFSSAKTVADVLEVINGSGLGITASLKESGNGIEIKDTTGGTGDLIIADNSSTTAAELGIAGTFSTAVASVKGANLQRQWVGSNTLLSTFNGGAGVAPGTFKMTNSLGIISEVDLSQGNEVTVQDVIDEINSKGISITASINANGDGLLLTDSAGGPVAMKVEEVGGKTAADLNILGTASGTTIEGSWEKTIAVTALDTLSSVQTKINDLGFGVSAGIINDGSGASPFRLSLAARNTGRAGRVVFDAGASGVQTRNLVEAQDAVVFYGAAGGSDPLIITSSTNQLTNVIKGVTIDLHGASTQAVSVSVSDNPDAVLSELKKFAETFNGMVDRLQDLTSFDAESKKRGTLLGESTVQQVESELYAAVQTVVGGVGRYRILSEVGLKTISGARLEVDEDKFRAAYAKDADSVRNLFVTADKGVGAVLEKRINKLIDPVGGVITRQNDTLDKKTTQFQDRIDQLDKLLEAKRARLEKQFANLEAVISGLQSQQAALSSFTGVKPITSSSSS